jgi:hypothetical protein
LKSLTKIWKLWSQHQKKKLPKLSPPANKEQHSTHSILMTLM